MLKAHLRSRGWPIADLGPRLFGFVVGVLQKVFGYGKLKAWQLTLTAHLRGRSTVWTGALEVAELKAEQIRTFHEVRERDGADLGPLGCSVEPAPGG